MTNVRPVLSEHSRKHPLGPSPIYWASLAIVLLFYVASCYAASEEAWRWSAFQITSWALITIFVTQHVREGNGDWLHPLILICVLLYLYTTSSAAAARQEDVTYHGVLINDDILHTFYSCSIVGLTGLILGSWIRQLRSRRLARLAPPQWVMPNGECLDHLWSYGLLLGIPLWRYVIGFFNPFGVAAYSEVACEVRLQWADDPAAVFQSVLARVPAQGLYGAAILELFRARHPVLAMIGLVTIVAYLMVPLRGGFRGEVIGAVIMVVAYYHYRIRSLNLKTIVLCLGAGYVFVTAMSIARFTNNPVEMIKLVVAEWEAESFAIFGLTRSSEFLTAQNLMAQIRFIEDGETTFTYGASILSELLVFIPRVFFSQRPLSLAEQFTEIMEPGALSLGKGYAFFILQEGYWIYGLPGVFIMMATTGWILERLYQWFMGFIRYDIVLLAYGAMLSVAAASVRSGIVGQFKTGLMLTLPFVVLGYLPRLRGFLRHEFRASWNSKKSGASHA